MRICEDCGLHEALIEEPLCGICYINRYLSTHHQNHKEWYCPQCKQVGGIEEKGHEKDSLRLKRPPKRRFKCKNCGFKWKVQWIELKRWNERRINYLISMKWL